MVTDLAEVFRLGTAKAEENLGFRRYICAHHYADKPFQILASDYNALESYKHITGYHLHPPLSTTSKPPA